MNGYYDEAGNPQLIKNGLFVNVSFWTEQTVKHEILMRGCFKELRFDGYKFEEIKGYKLNSTQRARVFSKIKETYGNSIQLEIIILHMNSLIADHNLFHPRQWSETEIHQALLYNSLNRKLVVLKKMNSLSANVLIDRRYTLPKSFFIKIQRNLRKKFASNEISVNPANSNSQKGIQLADVVCNACYSAVGITSKLSVCDAENIIQTEIPLPVSVKIPNAQELIRMLNEFHNFGGAV